MTNCGYSELGVYLADFEASSFLMFKGFCNEIDINQCDFLIFCNEMGQYLEELHYSLNQYFTEDHCVVLQIQVGVKIHSKCKADRQISCNKVQNVH